MLRSSRAPVRKALFLAVLPDFERWGENYVLIDFDGDPTADHPRLQKLPGHKRQQLAGLIHSHLNVFDCHPLPPVLDNFVTPPLRTEYRHQT